MAATFFLSWLFVIPACMSLGFTYEELEKAAVSYCGKIITSVFILLSVGGMIGAWIAAGTVSAIVDVGLRMITPKIFLLVTFIVGALYAMAVSYTHLEALRRPSAALLRPGKRTCQRLLASQ